MESSYATDLNQFRKIVITGGAGFIGSHLVDLLTAHYAGEIVVLDNLRRGNLDNLAKHTDCLQFVEGDIRSIEMVERVFNGADLVFHLAAQSNVLGAEQDLVYSFTTNVDGTFNVLRAAAAQGVSRVVFSSSREVYGDVTHLPVSESAPLAPKNAYGASKATGELYCRVFKRSGLDVRVLRLANVYGPRDHGRVIPLFVERALRGEPLILYGGDQILDFIWVGLVVEALVRAACHPALPEAVNVANSHGMTIRELAERVQAAVGSTVAIEVHPRREQEVLSFVGDATLARKLLNLPLPADPLFGLSEVIAWMSEQIQPS
ncbi:MAG TPA: NAD-dependent epimerase/dehydratase family protein [Chloroflexota bacterium]|nr:NAD-dependent epimerase/dehydratase family protein [Chloroflexota bacterium]